MKINNLKINGFGKLSNKEIKLDKNINIIYGKNEAGKSTLLNFIKSVFYGSNKNKNGKTISDFDKYEPWKTTEYSGSISYELDNGKKFEVFRDFRKKKPIIYNENKEDISSDYQIDKTKGIDFIYDQINLDQDTFENTVVVAQNDIKISSSKQNEMIQKISNIVSSGDENISYKKTLEKINKSQLEQIGTDRTKEKPINIVNDKIEKLKSSKGKLENYKGFVESSDSEVQEIQNKIDTEETKLSLYRVIKESNEKNKIKNSEIDVIKNIRDSDLEKIEELDDKVDKDAKESLKKEKKSPVFSIILILALIVIAIVCFVLKVNKLIPIYLIGGAVVILILSIIFTIIFNKKKKAKLKEIEDLEKNIEKEISVLRNNIKARQNEIDIKEEEIKQVQNEINRIVMNRFENKLDSDFIESAFELKDDMLDVKIADKNDAINNLKIEKGAKQSQKELMAEEINDLSKIEEELERLEEEKEDLISLNNSYNIAKEGLENAYENIKNSLSPEFTSKLCEIISKVSNEKYKEVGLVDKEGLVLKAENGRFVSSENLSQGTIDQMYLGLRLASIDTISKEKMPVILDETFAFFDDDRLKNILEFLNDNYKDKQVIIFSCSKREIEQLNKLNIDYNYVELEN